MDLKEYSSNSLSFIGDAVFTLRLLPAVRIRKAGNCAVCPTNNRFTERTDAREDIRCRGCADVIRINENRYRLAGHVENSFLCQNGKRLYHKSFL